MVGGGAVGGVGMVPLARVSGSLEVVFRNNSKIIVKLEEREREREGRKNVGGDKDEVEK